MSGSGTDKTKTGVELTGPVVILVEPQLGENIGTAARAMANFGLADLRVVSPREGWPSERAIAAARLKAAAKATPAQTKRARRERPVRSK